MMLQVVCELLVIGGVWVAKKTKSVIESHLVCRQILFRLSTVLKKESIINTYSKLLEHF